MRPQELTDDEVDALGALASGAPVAPAHRQRLIDAGYAAETPQGLQATVTGRLYLADRKDPLAGQQP